MNLIDSLLIAAAVGLLIIGVDQTMKGFFLQSYWVFMLLAMTIIGLRLRRGNAAKAPQQATPKITHRTKTKKKVRRRKMK